MKKIYFAPDTTMVKVELSKMIASSPGDMTLNKNATPVSSGDDVGSRGGNFWDDED